MSDDAILSAQKSFLRGPVTNNGFVNFMRDYAAKSGGLDVPDAITGGKLWNRLTSAQRKSYRMVDAEVEDNDNEESSSSDKGSDNEDVEMDDGDDGDDTDDNMGEGCCPKKRKRKPCCPPPCPRKRRRKPCCPPSPCCPKKRKRKPCCPKPKPCCPRPRRKPCCPRPKRRKPCCPTPCCPKPKPRPRPCCPRPRKRRCPRPRPRCPRKARCMRPGPITNNGYLNFLRFYRRKHCGLKPKELIMKAARAWCRLPECKKDFYRRQACKVTKSCRHKRRRVCTGK